MKKFNLNSILTFLIFLVFPFGQLLRGTIGINGLIVVINALDVLVLLFFLVNIKNLLADKIVFNYPRVTTLVLFMFFSMIASLAIFKNTDIWFGILYMVRIVSYFIFYHLLSKNNSQKNKNLLINVVFSLLVCMAVFGWVQYFMFPNLTVLKIYGWDDHLYRLTGTLLDPGFTSILLVFASIMSIWKFEKSKNKSYLVLFIFLCLSVLFTYSRAGYLALAVGLLTFFIISKKLKLFIVSLALLAAAVLFLPTPAGEGVNLTRTYSIFTRLVNYQTTVDVFLENPVVGVGYNNLCLVKRMYFGVDSASHSCSGSDSSILLILATGGVIGAILVFDIVLQMLKNKSIIKNKLIVFPIIAALFVHTNVNNSLFYPWVMAFLAIFFAGVRTSSEQ